jgi:RNA polymerase sigma-70 factor, ECF subfamily
MLTVFSRPTSGAAAVRALAEPAAKSPSDEALVERIAAGDQLAMQALFVRHRMPVYRWLLRFVTDQTLAEDLLSEVFLDVWRQAGRFEGRSSFSTWMLSIARFKALSARRRRTEAELDERIETTVADPANDPEAVLQENERSELVRQACRLSQEHREIIDLVYYHEKSVDDCAQILGIPAATVKTRMFYARKKLASWSTMLGNMPRSARRCKEMITAPEGIWGHRGAFERPMLERPPHVWRNALD